MNALKAWIQRSRKEAQRRPDRYLSHYPELKMDDENVYVDDELLERIDRACGRYDGTLPTGEYLGKMFLRGQYLCWFGISKENPQTHVAIKSRKVMVVHSARLNRRVGSR